MAACCGKCIETINQIKKFNWMESVNLHQSMKKYPANNSFRDAKKLHSHGCVSNITISTRQRKARDLQCSIQEALTCITSTGHFTFRILLMFCIHKNSTILALATHNTLVLANYYIYHSPSLLLVHQYNNIRAFYLVGHSKNQVDAKHLHYSASQDIILTL